MDQSKLSKILRDGNTRSPYLFPEKMRVMKQKTGSKLETGHETKDWFKIGKGLLQGYILLPCLFNFYVEYIMRNARLEESQVGIKIARININNLR